MKITHLFFSTSESQPNENEFFLYWNSFNTSNNSNIISLPEYIEKNSKVIRARYLKWVNSLQFKKNKKNRILNYFYIRQNFSYWWLTPTFQNCNYLNSIYINDVLKFFALEIILKKFKIDSIQMDCKQKVIFQILEPFFKVKNIKVYNTMKFNPFSLLNDFASFAYVFIEGLVWLFYYLFSRIFFNFISLNNWKKSRAKILFINYLDASSIDQSLKENSFISTYWGNLPDKLKFNNVKSNWLHIYVGGVFLTFRTLLFFNFFGKISKKSLQNHICLDSFLTPCIFFNVFLDWFKIAINYRKICTATFFISNKSFNVYPLYRLDLFSSFFGKNAFKNLLYLNLFESALKQIRKQSKCIYLQENQSWEVAFLHAFKNYGHLSSIGHPHSTIRFWDLRYHHDKTFYYSKSPQPNFVAVNGSNAYNSLLSSGFPKKIIRNVEALRYLYLNSFNFKEKHFSNKFNILLLGDFVDQNNKFLLNMVKNIFYDLPKHTKIIFKPHPFSSFDPSKIYRYNLTISKASIKSLLKLNNIVITSNATSASVDAYCAGVKVITVLDPSTLNFSPLLNCRDICLVRSESELLEALIKRPTKIDLSTRRKFFNLDKSLKSWIKLIS